MEPDDSASKMPLSKWAEYYISLYRDGVFCDAILWDGLATKLSTENALAILDGLAIDSKELLLERWNQQPNSFPLNETSADVRAIITLWCESSSK